MAWKTFKTELSINLQIWWSIKIYQYRVTIIISEYYYQMVILNINEAIILSFFQIYCLGTFIIIVCCNIQLTWKLLMARLKVDCYLILISIGALTATQSDPAGNHTTPHGKLISCLCIPTLSIISLPISGFMSINQLSKKRLNQQ